MSSRLGGALAAMIAVTLTARVRAGEGVLFPAALDTAAIVQQRLDSICENSLILGNGDLNGLLYSQGGTLVLRITKNDVWDARIDTSGDPPLSTIDIKNWRTTDTEGSWPGWSKPYPCPRACAHVVLGRRTAAPPGWEQIRGGGKKNEWRFHEGAAVMSIEGNKYASCGYGCGPLALSTDHYPTVRVRLSGSTNAQFFVEVQLADGAGVFTSLWIQTPTASEERTFNLPPNAEIDKLVLYTWTTDGRPAENRFEVVTFEGPGAKYSVDLKTAGAGRASVLDLRRAVASVAAAGEMGVPETEVRALAQRNVFLIDSPGPARLEPIRSAQLPAAEKGETNGVKWLAQTIPGDPDWPGMRFAVALAAVGDRKAVAVVTSRESPDPAATAAALAASTLAANRDALIAEHEQCWKEFWSASGVDVEDALLRNAWYRNLYFFRSVSKPGVVAVCLFAGLVDDSPGWHGGHTINYNTEQTFQAAFSSNHVELAQPVEQLVMDYLPRARWLAKKTYNCGGAFFPHQLYPYERADPEKCQSKNHRAHFCTPWAHTIGCSGFLVQNLWWHYQYQPDREYLEKVVWPALRDVAVFYADFMDQCREAAPSPNQNRQVGTSPPVILAPSVSPEHWGWTANMSRNRNCAFDIAFVRFTFRAAIAAAAILGREADLVERWKRQLARLPDYPTTKGPEPIVVDVEDAPPITYNIAIPAVPVFPGEQVTWFSSESEKRLFRRTIEGLRWDGHNSTFILAIARARLSMPGTLAWLNAEVLRRSRPNGTVTLSPLGHMFNNFGHYTEQFAAALAVNELLLQSVDGVVRVFPAWPTDKAARFEDLRALGGFLVSAEQSGGQVKQVRVTSTVGGKLRLLSPWKAVAVKSSTHRPSAAAPDSRGIVEIATESGERLIIGAAD